MSYCGPREMEHPNIHQIYAAVFPTLRKDLLSYVKSLNSPAQVVERLEKVS